MNVAVLREEVRAWLIDAKFGVIDHAELVARADRAIGALDEPPDYLIALSLGEPLFHEPRLDLVKEPLAEEDLGGLAVRLLARLEAGNISPEEIAAIAARIAFPRDVSMLDAWLEFDWIAEEQHLIEEGIKDGSDFGEGVATALRKVAGYAAE